MTCHSTANLFSSAGDWRQVCPVLEVGTETEILEQAFLSAYLWQNVQRFRVTVSMRDRNDIPFAKTVLAVGEGNMEPALLPDGTPAMPLTHTVTTGDSSEATCSIAGSTNFERLVDRVYPDLSQVLITTLTMTVGFQLSPTTTLTTSTIYV